MDVPTVYLALNAAVSAVAAITSWYMARAEPPIFHFHRLPPWHQDPDTDPVHHALLPSIYASILDAARDTPPVPAPLPPNFLIASTLPVYFATTALAKIIGVFTWDHPDPSLFLFLEVAILGMLGVFNPIIRLVYRVLVAVHYTTLLLFAPIFFTLIFIYVLRSPAGRSGYPPFRAVVHWTVPPQSNGTSHTPAASPRQVGTA